MPYDAIRAALVSSVRGGSSRHSAATRVLDVVVALLALLVFAPLMVFVALAIAMEGRGPVLFQHARVGAGGRTFIVLKFRTMMINGEEVLRRHLIASQEARTEWEADHKLRNDPRVSQLGAVLRKSSVDELPQLWNVLRGDMSIVGPRPIVAAEIGRYGPHFEEYCSVRPGITGIWQVSGRNDISYTRRVQMDALYARKKSFWLDLKIIVMTIPAVLMRRGSY